MSLPNSDDWHKGYLYVYQGTIGDNKLFLVTIYLSCDQFAQRKHEKANPNIYITTIRNHVMFRN